MAIWGCGPVGILAAHSADVKGAERIVMIDNQQYRLDFAKQRIPRIETINFDVHKNVRGPLPLPRCLLLLCVPMPWGAYMLSSACAASWHARAL